MTLFIFHHHIHYSSSRQVQIVNAFSLWLFVAFFLMLFPSVEHFWRISSFLYISKCLSLDRNFELWTNLVPNYFVCIQLNMSFPLRPLLFLAIVPGGTDSFVVRVNRRRKNKFFFIFSKQLSRWQHWLKRILEDID